MDLFSSVESKSLCIIGNGFDIHHGLETKYWDFYKYLKMSGACHEVDQLESFFQAQNIDDKGNRSFLLWSDLEGALGEYDIEEMYHECTDFVSIDYDHYMRSAAQIEDSPNFFLAPVVESLPQLIKQWISQVAIYGISPDVNLPDYALFLSFNYTRVLEDIYKVPKDTILHIHGVVGGESALIVGHNVKMDEREAFDEDAPLYEDESKLNIIKIMNGCRKPIEELISTNGKFFQSLRDITDVYVYGHSYSFVDLDYFKEVKKSVLPKAMWHLSFHNEKDETAAKKMMEELGVETNYWGKFHF